MLNQHWRRKGTASNICAYNISVYNKIISPKTSYIYIYVFNWATINVSDKCHITDMSKGTFRKSCELVLVWFFSSVYVGIFCLPIWKKSIRIKAISCPPIKSISSRNCPIPWSVALFIWTQQGGRCLFTQITLEWAQNWFFSGVIIFMAPVSTGQGLTFIRQEAYPTIEGTDLFLF